MASTACTAGSCAASRKWRSSNAGLALAAFFRRRLAGERVGHLPGRLFGAAGHGGRGLPLRFGGGAASRRAGNGVGAGQPHAEKGILLAPGIFHGAASSMAGGAAPGMMPGAGGRRCRSQSGAAAPGSRIFAAVRQNSQNSSQSPPCVAAAAGRGAAGITAAGRAGRGAAVAGARAGADAGAGASAGEIIAGVEACRSAASSRNAPTTPASVAACSCIEPAAAAASSTSAAFCCVDLVHLRDRLIDLLDAGALLVAGRGDLGHDVGHALHAGDDLAHGRAGLTDQLAAGFDLLHRVADQGLDLLGRRGRALRQAAHFGRHHREAAALLAGAGRFDRRVQRQDIGLEGDAVDDADDVDDLARRRVDRAHGVDHLVDHLRRPRWPRRRRSAPAGWPGAHCRRSA